MVEIPGWPGYFVTKTGEVWSSRSNKGWRKLKPGLYKGHHGVCLSDGKGHAQSFSVASLVLVAFVGPRPLGMQACHTNGVNDDDRLENLRWDTPTENHADRIRHGRTPGRKLTQEQAEEIRHSSKSQRELAKIYGVSQRVIFHVIHKDTYKGVKHGY